ncbi:hypothetical protein [Mycobacterium basiliense]|uniref:hypothetical protein n=1 Tax=Mycobacterium basiliense TaxID=2094119 RepID=UPI001E580955|nr:hypothetical protein [Mycobacterium basiliense]
MAFGTASLVCLSGVLVGCGERGGGSPKADFHPDPARPVPGIVATEPEHIPPDTVACVPSLTGEGRAHPANVSDPAAPRITLNVPDGWTSVAGSGDTASILTGPDGMTAKVTITPTDLPPDRAFLGYTSALRGSAPGFNFSIAGDPFCGYSSELLTGTLRGSSGAIQFADRITHIWTNTKQYLVAIHLEGPTGVAGFSVAKSALMQNFAIVIP